jgi:hypothetical protein
LPQNPWYESKTMDQSRGLAVLRSTKLEMWWKQLMQWKAEKINRVHASWKLSEKMDAMKVKREIMDEMETPKRDLERWSLIKNNGWWIYNPSKGKIHKRTIRWNGDKNWMMHENLCHIH